MGCRQLLYVFTVYFPFLDHCIRGLSHQGLSTADQSIHFFLFGQTMGPNSCLHKGHKLAQSFYAPESKIFEVQAFHHLRSSLGAKQEHVSLLQDFREFDWARVDLEENGGFEGQALLKEQAAVIRSTGQVLEILMDLLFGFMQISFYISECC